MEHLCPPGWFASAALLTAHSSAFVTCDSGVCHLLVGPGPHDLCILQAKICEGPKSVAGPSSTVLLHVLAGRTLCTGGLGALTAIVLWAKHL